MKLDKKTSIFVAGHRGLVGSAILRQLVEHGCESILTADRSHLDLTDQNEVAGYLKKNRPELVILAAAKVGGINSNIKSPAEFIYENLMIQNNVIHQSYLSGVKKLLFLGSSCIYPRQCPQPMKEEYLLTGKLEPTNEGYALAKIAGLKMCEYYNTQYGFDTLSLMPCNIYGPGDSFDLEHSHVLSALVKRFVDASEQGAKSVTLWGTGVARREFLHVRYLAEAVLFMLENYSSSEFINIGSGSDVSIKDLATNISELVHYQGEIIWDSTKPDGMLKKCLDVTKMKEIGFCPKTTLEDGIKEVIEDYYKVKNKHD
ncbi:MAG: GDP-L-fucose synthase [Anaerohalosphaera sp.]|nr:GDP-L-fucose synthase [Anaerohalosphaera sp.]